MRYMRVVGTALTIIIMVLLGYMGGAAAVAGPTFDYPVDGQELDLEGIYLFAVEDYPGAESYDWELRQGEVVVSAQEAGSEFGVGPDTPGYDGFTTGTAVVTVVANLEGGEVTDPSSITIVLRPRPPVIEFPIDGSTVDLNSGFSIATTRVDGADSYTWRIVQRLTGAVIERTTGGNGLRIGFDDDALLAFETGEVVVTGKATVDGFDTVFAEPVRVNVIAIDVAPVDTIDGLDGLLDDLATSGDLDSAVAAELQSKAATIQDALDDGRSNQARNHLLRAFLNDLNEAVELGQVTEEAAADIREAVANIAEANGLS